MYDSVRAMRSGWTRILIEGCGRRVWRLRYAALELCITSILLPTSCIAGIVLGSLGTLRGDDHALALAAISGAALVAGFAALGLVHQRQRAPLAWAVLHPIAAGCVAWWLLDGARMLVRRVPIRWGGKEYILEPRIPRRRKKPAAATA